MSNIKLQLFVTVEEYPQLHEYLSSITNKHFRARQFKEFAQRYLISTTQGAGKMSIHIDGYATENIMKQTGANSNQSIVSTQDSVVLSQKLTTTPSDVVDFGEGIFNRWG